MLKFEKHKPKDSKSSLNPETNPRKSMTRHITIKLLKTEDKNILKEAREKYYSNDYSFLIRNCTDKKEWNVLKCERK